MRFAGRRDATMPPPCGSKREASPEDARTRGLEVKAAMPVQPAEGRVGLAARRSYRRSAPPELRVDALPTLRGTSGASHPNLGLSDVAADDDFASVNLFAVGLEEADDRLPAYGEKRDLRPVPVRDVKWRATALAHDLAVQ